MHLAATLGRSFTGTSDSRPPLLRIVSAPLWLVGHGKYFSLDAAITRGQRGQPRYHAWTCLSNSAYTYTSGWMDQVSLAYWQNPKSLPPSSASGNRSAEFDAKGIIVGSHERQP
jgi:hypothetical protein